MLEETAAEKLLRIFNKFYEYRNSQIEILKANPLNFSETVGINATIINGGVQINVVPAEFSISFDIRIGPNVNHDEFENMIRDWCKDDGFSIEFEQKDPYVEPTKIDDSNKYWIAMNKAMEEMYDLIENSF
jgi:aminoacylase